MRFSRAVRVLTFAVAAAVGWSLWAACAEAPMATSAQMACCKDGEFKCAPHGSASDCCTTDAARPHHAIAVAKLDPAHRLTAVAWAVLPNPLSVGSPRSTFFQSISPPRLDPGPPPYIAFSSLLI